MKKVFHESRTIPLPALLMYFCMAPMLCSVPCFGQATDELTYVYATVTENATTFSGTIVVSNPNSAYA
jgi:hypothetical protein